MDNQHRKQRDRLHRTETFVIVGSSFASDEIGRLKACIRDINNDRKKRHWSPLFYRFR